MRKKRTADEVIREIEKLNASNEKSKAMALLEEAKREGTLDSYQYEKEYLMVIKEF